MLETKEYVEVKCIDCGESRNIKRGSVRKDRGKRCRSCSAKNVWNTPEKANNLRDGISRKHTSTYNILPYGESCFNSLYSVYKGAAIRRSYVFELNKEEFKKITKENCFYCDCLPSQVVKERGFNTGDYIYNGIDRIDNNKGYTKDNVVSCCKHCNKAKSTLTQEDFFKLIKDIYEKHNLSEE
jgi:hypothetical protein